MSDRTAAVPQMRTLIKTTCPRDCYDACGIVVVKDDGIVRRVLGDPDHAIARGSLCGKCAVAYNGAWRSLEQRLTTPLKRVGAKGEGKFKEVGWDEALSEIAGRLQPLIASGNAASILHTHYTGTVALISGWFPIRFFNRIGATEIDPDSVCNKAGHVVLEMMFGTSLDGFDPETIEHAQSVVIWGANPANSAPHQFRHWLPRAKGPLIVIDPITTGTAKRADIHLKLKPGSDAALAYGLMNVAMSEGLLDEEFIRENVLGFDEIAPLIEAATPAVTTAATGIAEADLREVARSYAKGPSLLWLGQGMQRQPRGGNAFRAAAALAAITGNIGKPGAGFLYMNGPGARGVDMNVLTAPHLNGAAADAISHMDLAGTLGDAARAKVIFTWNNNIVASSPQQQQLREALSRPDLFHVASDIFHTGTTEYADFILPAASFLEFDDLVLSYFDLTISAQVKTMEPVGQSLPNQEIFRRLAAKMELQDPELYETDSAILRKLLEQTNFSGSFDELGRVGTVRAFSDTRVPFADGEFATPSGKVEIACERMEAQGNSRIPLPHADVMPALGRFRVLSPASQWQMNSSYGNDMRIRNQMGPPDVLVHPADAEHLGVEDGDMLVLGNASGRLTVIAKTSADAQPGMFIVHKGRWPGLDGSNANVNVLFDGRKSDFGESTTVHGIEVDLIETHRSRLERAAS